MERKDRYQGSIGLLIMPEKRKSFTRGPPAGTSRFDYAPPECRCIFYLYFVVTVIVSVVVLLQFEAWFDLFQIYPALCPIYHPCGIGPFHSRSLASKPCTSPS